MELLAYFLQFKAILNNNDTLILRMYCLLNVGHILGG